MKEFVRLSLKVLCVLSGLACIVAGFVARRSGDVQEATFFINFAILLFILGK